MRRIPFGSARLPAGVAALALLAVGILPDPASAERRHHRVTPRYPYAAPFQPYAGRGPDYGGYTNNGFGYGGRYTRGPDGGFGGYPPGSAGAIILRQ